MRYLNPGAPLGLYHAPQAYYGYTKALPFQGTVKSNVQTLVVGKWTGIVIVYEVGASGLADGAWIKGTSWVASRLGLDERVDWLVGKTFRTDKAGFVLGHCRGPACEGEDDFTTACQDWCSICS